MKPPEERLAELVSALSRQDVRFLLIGVAGANLYARTAGLIFTTQDYDLLLPLDAANELRAWRACDERGLELWCGDEPLGAPLEESLARQVVGRRALVRAEGEDLLVDLSLVMAGFGFEEVWRDRRLFRIGDVDLPVARLAHIVSSKAKAARPKDQLFLATHEDALRQLAGRRTGPRGKKLDDDER